MGKVTYPNKSFGNQFSAANANEVKAVINEHDDKIAGAVSGFIDAIAFDAAAPVPGKSGFYEFSSAGSCAWITGGAVVVGIGDRVAVKFTTPSTYTYKYIKVNVSNLLAAKAEVVAPILTIQPDVAIFADLATIYSEAVFGFAARVLSDGYIYSFNGTLPWKSTGLTAFPTDVIIKSDMFDIYKSPNLFDKNNIIADKYLNTGNGDLVNTVGYYTTDFMPLSASAFAISNSNFTFIAFYDSNKAYITGITEGGQRSIQNPANGACFRISFTYVAAQPDTTQVQLGIESTPYESFGTTITPKFKSIEGFTTITARRYSGGQFNGNNAIQDAINSIMDADETNQYIIEPEGVFVAYLPEHYTQNFGALKSFIQTKPFVHIISKNKNNCIINCFLADNLGLDFPYYNYQNINHNVNNSRIEGLTFLASNIRYAVHIDADNENFNIPFKFCTVWNKGNIGDALAVWASPSPFGIGMTSGMKLLIEDCEVKGIDYAMYAHTNNTFSKPSEIKFNRCKIITTNCQDNIIMHALPLGTGCMDRFIVENCDVDEGGIDIRSTPWYPDELVNQRADHAEYELILPSMKPRAIFNSSLTGKGLRIKSKSTGEGSTVNFDSTSTAFNAIIGNSLISVEIINKYNRCEIFGYQYKYGGQGLSGYAIGSLDIGQYLVGGSVNKYIGALGKRLGDCSTINKTLTVYIDGVTHNIVFNKNYNGTNEFTAPTYSNSQILSEITAIIGTVSTVDEYVVGRDYYPQFSGVLNMKNADTTEVLAGMGVVFTGLKTFRKALNSDGRIDGICLDDGRVGDECRVIIEGEIYSSASNERFSTYDSAGWLSMGSKFGISSTIPGKFDIAANPKVLICNRDNVVTFIK